MVILAFIVGLIALVIAWAAYNRAGTDLEEQAVQETEEGIAEVEEGAETAAEETEQAAARAEARTELLAVRARVEADENYAEAVSEVNQIEDRLAAAYEDAGEDARQEWAEMQQEFDQLEAGLRSGTANVLELFAGLTLLLENEIRVDEEPD